jgi:hypothetical protein
MDTERRHDGGTALSSAPILDPAVQARGDANRERRHDCRTGHNRCTAVAAGAERMRIGASALHPANSLFDRTNSLFGQKRFPVSGGTGNWLQALDSGKQPAPKAAPDGRNRAKFSKSPC